MINYSHEDRDEQHKHGATVPPAPPLQECTHPALLPPLLCCADAGPKGPRDRMVIRTNPSYRGGRHYGAMFVVFIPGLM